MNQQVNTKDKNQFLLIISIGLLLISSVLSLIIFENQSIGSFIMLVIGGLLSILIIQYPPLGLGTVLVTTPLVDLLPDIPILSSAIPLLGLITVIGFITNKSYKGKIGSRLTNVELIAIVFIAWVVISNPEASILGLRRQWIFTFFQLWILLWIGSHFIQSEKDHHLIMIIMAIGITTSAVVAVLQSGGDFNEFQRAAGLSGGANTAARYYVYGLVLLFYLLRQYARRKIARLFFLLSSISLIAAVIFSGSRSGIVLLFIAVVFELFISVKDMKNSIVIILVLAAGLFWFFQISEGTILDPEAISTSVTSGTDTMGTRYDLWEAGWQMFLDHPVKGVGIGRFRELVSFYTPSFGIKSSHNTYIQVLSETGIVGLLFFLILLFVVIKSQWNNFRLRSNTSITLTTSSINRTWLILLVILLVGAITKEDLVDKFFWFLLGINTKNN